MNKNLKQNLIPTLILYILISLTMLSNIHINLYYDVNETGNIQLFYNNHIKDAYPFDGNNSIKKNIDNQSQRKSNFLVNIDDLEKIRIDIDYIEQIAIKKITLSTCRVNIFSYNTNLVLNRISGKNDVDVKIVDETIDLKSTGDDSYIEINSFLEKNVINMIKLSLLLISIIITLIIVKILRIIKDNKILNLERYNRLIFYLVSSFILLFIIESIHRGSIIQTFKFKEDKNIEFIINYLILLLILSPMLILKNNILVLTIISEILIILVSIGYMVSKFRGYPMTFFDIYSVKEGIAIAKEYLDIETIIIIISLIIIFLIVIYNSIKIYKIYQCEMNYKIYSILTIIIVTLCSMVICSSIQNKKLITDQSDLKSSYDKNGFIYSYINSYFSYIKKKPENYTYENMQNIKKYLDEVGIEDKANNIKPNIIFIQLESVMDISNISALDLSSDPLININEYRKQYSSGMLSVPTIGGGTARTEFEVLTSNSLDYLSPGEIPNMSILKKQYVESMASCLSIYGYESTLIHNYHGDFYDRHKVYSNLGFDRYIPMQYMYGLDRTREFPKDIILLDNIISLIEKDKTPKFIYSIGVQTHGSYDSEYNSDDSKIKINGNIEQKAKNQAQQYIDNLAEVDEFIKYTVEYLEELNEPTVLVVFSDHLPTLADGTDKYITESEKYKTPYFIYNNIGLSKVDKDLEAYQLSSYVLESLKLDGSIINEVHTLCKNEVFYNEILELVQYDILYGGRYLLDEEVDFNKNMKLGLEEIVITDVDIKDESIDIYGTGFNEFSCIYINNKKVKTEYINNNHLKYKGTINNIKEINVKQLGRYGNPIGETSIYAIEE